MVMPTQFTEQATRMEVKGKGNKQLRFGNYHTSKVKRGRLITTTRPNRRTAAITEDRISKIFKLDQSNVTESSKDKFRYSINNGNLVAEVMASENKSTDQLIIKTNNRWLGDFGKTKEQRYSFSAVIVPLIKDTAAWQVIVYNGKHEPDSTKKSWLRFPLETGFATNGIDTITINQIRVTKVITSKGKEATSPFELPGGYELRIDDGVAAIISTWNKEVWIYNELDEPTKLIVSAVASSLMLRRIHDTR
jgi:hypothetical protein